MISRTMLIFSLFMILLFPASSLLAQYQIPAGVLGSSGGIGSDSDHRLYSTTGQTFIGQAQGGNFRLHAGFWRPAQIIMPIQQIFDGIPIEYHLGQNYPNPFNPSTAIRYEVAHRGGVELLIFNTLGQRVAILVNEEKDAGRYSVVWDGRNEHGVQVGSGMYFYRLYARSAGGGGQAGEFVQSKKLIFLK